MKALSWFTGRRVVALAVIVALVGGGVVAARRLGQRRNALHYITRPVGYADIAATVNETGTVNPVNPPGTVQIGTQVSGTINAIFVDYNSKVKKDEVLATLDPVMFQDAVNQDAANLDAAQATASAADSTVQQQQAAVKTAQATLQQNTATLHADLAALRGSQATLALANVTVSRDHELLAQGFIPQNQLDTDATAVQTDTANLNSAQETVAAAQAQVDAAASQVGSAQAQLQTSMRQATAAHRQAEASASQLAQAQYNLSQTVIKSPIDGIVLGRSVSIGQTVAASLQTPTLFTLAQNLTDMQVDTSVDEADIGPVQAGEKAQISVTAFPNVTFSGVVKLVELNPTIVSNVVTYDAVVLVHDPQERLKPGMTAQVAIDVLTRSHVLAVPVSALLYRPLTQAPAQPATPGGFVPGAGGPGGPGGGPGGTAAGGPVAGAPGSHVTVWVLRGGRQVPVAIVIGYSDGQNVEVRSGDLHEGDRVIIAAVRGGRGQGGGRYGGGGGGEGGGGGGGGQQPAPGGGGGQPATTPGGGQQPPTPAAPVGGGGRPGTTPGGRQHATPAAPGGGGGQPGTTPGGGQPAPTPGGGTP
jgi:HlyD family secretion protein